MIDSYRPKKAGKPDGGWTIEEHHPAFMFGGECHELFEALCSELERVKPDWERYVKKYYVGFRTGGRKLRIAIQERVSDGSLAIGLTRSVDDLVDPEGRAMDKRDATGFGPGCPTRVDVRSTADVEAVVALITQC